MNVDIHAGYLRPLGYQQITITTAQVLTVPLGTACVIAVAEAQALRWRDDGVAPTTTVGYPEAVGVEFAIANPSTFQAIGQVAAGIINVTYYGASGQ
jgi:hypothetical protein